MANNIERSRPSRRPSRRYYYEYGEFSEPEADESIETFSENSQRNERNKRKRSKSITKPQVNSPIEGTQPNQQLPLPLELRRLLSGIRKEVGETHLHKACRLSAVEAVDWLLKNRKSIDVNVKDHAGYTPLHEVASLNSGSAEIGQLLLQAGANPNATSNDGMRPLHEAIDAGHINLVRLLLAYGADFNFPTYSGRTPISLAKSEVLKKFLEDYVLDLSGEKSSIWQFSSLSSVLDEQECAKMFSNIPDKINSKVIIDDKDITFDFFDIPIYRLKAKSDGDEYDFFLFENFMNVCFPDKTEKELFKTELKDAILIEITKDDIVEHDLLKFNGFMHSLPDKFKLILAEKKIRDLANFKSENYLTFNSQNNYIIKDENCLKCDELKKTLLQKINLNKRKRDSTDLEDKKVKKQKKSVSDETFIFTKSIILNPTSPPMDTSTTVTADMDAIENIPNILREWQMSLYDG